MAFTLYTLLEACLLFVNAIAVLNKERFLSKVGWTNDQVRNFGETTSTKGQIVNLISSVQTVMRVPLIFINIVVIVAKLLLG